MIRTDPPFTQPSAALIRPRIQSAALGLGSDPIAGAGNLRGPDGLLCNGRNTGDTADETAFVLPAGVSQLWLGSNFGATPVGRTTIDGSADVILATGSATRAQVTATTLRLSTTTLDWSSGVNNPILRHAQAAAGAGDPLLLRAQAAAAASGSGGGALDAGGGAGDGAGVDGPLQVSTAIAWPYAGNNIEALGAAKTLTVGDPHFQLLDPNGADRNVDTTADAEAIDTWFVVFNSGGANVLNLRDSAATALVTLAVGEAAIIVRDSTAGAWGVIGPL